MEGKEDTVSYQVTILRTVREKVCVDIPKRIADSNDQDAIWDAISELAYEAEAEGEARIDADIVDFYPLLSLEQLRQQKATNITD